MCIAGAIVVAAQTDQRQGNERILTKFGDNDRCSSVCQMSRLGGWKKGVGECCDMVPDGMSFACYE